MASTPSPRRRSARARRPNPPLLADSAPAPPPARRRAARARRPLQRPADAVFPDEIWEEILLRLDAASGLARASAACSTFRRVVSEPRFLRRFRSHHSAPVLGFITSNRCRRFFPVGPPHGSAPEARALERAADFTFAFLPDPCEWRFCHALDGRVLLSRFISLKIRFMDFAVCDPLHRRYVKIPRIPDDLMASAPDNAMSRHVLPVLAPAGGNDQEEESFRVICTVVFKDKVMAFVFSSCNQTWQGFTTTICLPDGFIEYVTCYAYGCLYWMVGLAGCLLMLDTREMKFSIVDLPPNNFDSTKGAIVEAADGRLGFVTISDGKIDLYCKNWQNNCGTQEWLHEKLIPLPKDFEINYRWQIEGTAGRYIALEAHQEIRDLSSPVSEHFVLDIKTLLVENLCTSQNGAFFGFPYARFPPPWALPSI